MRDFDLETSVDYVLPLLQTDIFKNAYDSKIAIQLTLLISVVNLLSTIGSSLIIEKVGRRTLLLTSEIGMALAASTVVIAIRINLEPQWIVASLMAYVGAFGVGLGGIPWYVV